MGACGKVYTQKSSQSFLHSTGFQDKNFSCHSASKKKTKDFGNFGEDRKEENGAVKREREKKRWRGMENVKENESRVA